MNINNIGWIYNEGPPHDHNHDWNGKYLEEFLPHMLFGKKRISFLVDENKEPILYEDKIIIDLYKLVKDKNKFKVLKIS